MMLPTTHEQHSLSVCAPYPLVKQLTFPVFRTHQGESTDKKWEDAEFQRYKSFTAVVGKTDMGHKKAHIVDCGG